MRSLCRSLAMRGVRARYGPAGPWAVDGIDLDLAPGRRLGVVGPSASLSAAFIMAANSWMQHPVGYTIDPTTGRP